MPNIQPTPALAEFGQRAAPSTDGNFCRRLDNGSNASADLSFRSILYEDGNECSLVAAPDCFRDLNLDQIVASITAGKDEYKLAPFFQQPLQTVGAILYRQGVMRDLDGQPLLRPLRAFSDTMRSMQEKLVLADKSYSPQQEHRWFLHAAETYCGAVQTLAAELAEGEVHSRGLSALRAWLAGYVSSAGFATLLDDCNEIAESLQRVEYAILIRGGEFQVRCSEAEQDYSLEIAECFEKFRQGAAKDYQAVFTEQRNANLIETKVLEFVSLLFPSSFVALADFRVQHAGFVDPVLARFDRELQFYVSYVDYMARFATVGLSFCTPVIEGTSRQVRSEAGFDLALATKLCGTGTQIVCNDFELQGGERILLVSGPNQGGKTTFARAFGQLHYLASLGCPVPGRRAELRLFDRIYTHFERQESVADLRGKLKDDLIRIHEIMEHASPASIVIMNEIFNSTTVADATFLARQVLERIVAKNLLCVCVTFLDELTEVSDTVVSMTSTVALDDVATRSFRIVRRAADGRSYAMSIAERYRLTYEDLLRRIPLLAAGQIGEVP